MYPPAKKVDELVVFLLLEIGVGDFPDYSQLFPAVFGFIGEEGIVFLKGNPFLFGSTKIIGFDLYRGFFKSRKPVPE